MLVLDTIDPLIRKVFIEVSDTVEKSIIDYAKKNNIDVIVIDTKNPSEK